MMVSDCDYITEEGIRPTRATDYLAPEPLEFKDYFRFHGTSQVLASSKSGAKEPESQHDSGLFPELLAHVTSLKDELEEYAWIYEEGADWDGEGIEAVEEATFRRAVALILDRAESLFRAFNFPLEAPRLSPGPKGSIDIHWERPDRELAVNIPAIIGAPITYYFRTDAGDKSSGRIASGKAPLVLLTLGC